MSLLDRLGRGQLSLGHLSDAQLARLWSSAQPAGATHPHLETCAGCRARYAALDGWLVGVGDTLRAEADEAFRTERLAAQQAQITRRLDTLERPTRVIPFPKAARAVISGHSHVRRWVTVAAAASLIAGFGLGQVMPVRHLVTRQQAAAPNPNFTAPVTAAIAKELMPVSTSLEDDELFTDAFRRPRVSTLSALDDMTPTARHAGK